MKSKTAIALAAALSTSLLAAPAVSHAESQFEWVQRQLQMTDGYAPPPPAVSAKDGIRSGASTYEGTALTVNPAQSDWAMRQLQITDGYAPVDGVPGKKNAVASEPDGARPTVIGERTQSEWFAQQLQMTDGYAPPPVVRAKGEKGTVTSAYQGVGTTQN
jgi:hypothetical protein